MGQQLVAPFPYFGGKRNPAAEIWRALGDVAVYAEPFCGSAAVLLARPAFEGRRIETINDTDGFVSNFWRAVRAAPDEVAEWADWPVNENDLHARHAWLVGQRDTLRARLEGDPEYCDAKVAGWWCWGACAWLGGGWCSGAGPWSVEKDADGLPVLSRNAGRGIKRKIPHLGNAGRGINRRIPHLGNAGQGINRQIPHLGNGQGINRQIPHLGSAGRGDFIYQWMSDLSARLRDVRVVSGDWSRIVTPATLQLSNSTSPIGVYLDPPYRMSECNGEVYTHNGDVTEAVLAWCREHGDDPRLRIVLSEYDGLDLPGWRQVSWKAVGGYSKDQRVRQRETLYISPYCLGGDAGKMPSSPQLKMEEVG